MQMDDIFILTNITFAKKKNNKLIKIALRIKFKKKLLNKHSLIFNKYIIKKNEKIIKLIQKKLKKENLTNKYQI